MRGHRSSTAEPADDAGAIVVLMTRLEAWREEPSCAAAAVAAALRAAPARSGNGASTEEPERRALRARATCAMALSAVVGCGVAKAAKAAPSRRTTSRSSHAQARTPSGIVGLRSSLKTEERAAAPRLDGCCP